MWLQPIERKVRTPQPGHSWHRIAPLETHNRFVIFGYWDLVCVCVRLLRIHIYILYAYPSPLFPSLSLSVSLSRYNFEIFEPHPWHSIDRKGLRPTSPWLLPNVSLYFSGSKAMWHRILNRTCLGNGQEGGQHDTTCLIVEVLLCPVGAYCLLLISCYMSL
jgi:hypothetical protein